MKHRKTICVLLTIAAVAALCCVPALAVGDVAAAVESPWNGATTQIKTVVEKAAFPALDMILTIAFFTKLGTDLF